MRKKDSAFVEAAGRAGAICGTIAGYAIAAFREMKAQFRWHDWVMLGAVVFAFVFYGVWR